MLIAIEGIDGAGTTTQAAMLAERLRAEQQAVLLTRQPSDGPIGALTRQALRRRIVRPDGEALSHATLALLFAADRLDHLASEVEPSLAAGKRVITDRYVHSSIAYQGAELDIEWVCAINREARVADLVIFIDIGVDEGLARVDARGGARDLFERADFLESVRLRYEDAFVLRPEPVVRVDGRRTIDEVHHAVWETVKTSLSS